MTDWNLARTPTLVTALRAQVASVARAMRWEARLIIAGLVLVGLAAFFEAAQGDTFNYPFEVAIVIAVAATGLPFAIWKGERLFSDGYLWSLPVDRPTHAWIKVLAGLAWLWAAISVVLASLALITLVTGGSLDGGLARPLMSNATAATSAMPLPAWMALTPFGGGLVAYLFGTALVLGVRHKLLWAIAAPAVGLVLLVLAGDLFGEVLLHAALVGPLGLDHAVSGGFEALEAKQVGTAGDTIAVWRKRPEASDWLGAVALWSALGAACVALATRRHREH